MLATSVSAASRRLLPVIRGGAPAKRHISIAVKMGATSPPNWTPTFVSANPTEQGTSECASFRIISYNILAQAYVKSEIFPHSPPACLKWKKRSKEVLSRILSFDADFLCLQELDEFDSFYKGSIESHGYSSLYIQRSGKKRDGCGIIYRTAACELLEKEVIDYNDLVPPAENGETSAADEDDRNVDDPRIRLRRNCVGILAAFRPSRCPERVIVIANTHLYWDPKLADVKLAQAKYLLWRLGRFEESIAEKFKSRPLILVAGDFNSTPGDQVYNYLVSGSRGEVSPDDVTRLEDVKAPSVPLHSLYATVQGEPPSTNFTPDFTGTLDYVFFSPSAEHLKPRTFLELPHPDSPEVMGGLPNHNHPSDHVAVGGDFSIPETA